MNKQILDKLMEINSIRSYHQLAQNVDLPYTTLLDLVKGKGERLSNIKTLANFFGVPLSTLIDNKETFFLINEDNKVISKQEYEANLLFAFLLQD